MRVVICKKAALFREALAMVVASRGHQVVSCVGTLDDAVPAIEAYHPDVMLLDVSLAGGGAMKALEDQRGRGLAPRLVLLSGPGEEDTTKAETALETGAECVLDDGVALRTLQRAVSGRPSSAGAGRRAVASATRPQPSALTAREREVMDLLAVGLSTDAMATTLHVSRSTVHSHVQSILRKLGARSRLQAVSIHLGETEPGLGRASGS